MHSVLWPQQIKGARCGFDFSQKMRSLRILSRHVRVGSARSVRPLASWAPKARAAVQAPPLQALAVIRRHGLLLQRRASWVAPHTEVAVVSGGKRLAVTWADGETKTFHAAWLRHNCRCPACWDPTSGQKVLPDSQLSGKLNVTSAGEAKLDCLK